MLSLTFPLRVAAHPVALGGLIVQIEPGKIRLTIRSSVEEICVAHSLRVGDNDEYSAETIRSACKRHAEYLLRHFEVKVGDDILAGEEQAFAPEGGYNSLSPLDVQKHFVNFELEFKLREGQEQKLPASVFVVHNMLEGLDYAPGNPWEAVYVMRTRVANKPYELTLLKPRAPVVFDVAQHVYTDGKVPLSNLPLDPSAGVTTTELAPDDAAKIEPQPGRAETRIDIWQTARVFLKHGIEHILEGWDHLLFVSALTLAAFSFWDLVKVVTAFTIAHTITLALSAFDLVPSMGGIVEPMIAGSIVAVALQNIFWPRSSRGLLRLALAFGFGLFHGLGFAGGLLETMRELPSAGIWSALAGFSVGVEIGHQIIVLPLFFALMLGRKRFDDAQARVEPEDAPPPMERAFALGALRYGSVVIGLAGCWYLYWAVS
ncbi:MAG TPA: HupE/UreJ family protein [Planctomycetota bacterium]|nr:HupE/UreJ family protein [Planctomycetota bacterium]